MVSRYWLALCATEPLMSSREPIRRQNMWARAVWIVLLCRTVSVSNNLANTVAFSTKEHGHRAKYNKCLSQIPKVSKQWLWSETVSFGPQSLIGCPSTVYRMQLLHSADSWRAFKTHKLKINARKGLKISEELMVHNTGLIQYPIWNLRYMLNEDTAINTTSLTSARGCKTFFMLNTTEHEIYPANKHQNVVIVIFISRINSVLSCVVQERSLNCWY